MISCYKCEKCGRVFTDYYRAYECENSHYEPIEWPSDDDLKVIKRETEYVPELYAPSAVVIPMERTIREESGEWKREVIYVKYYYSGKKAAEQVFPIDESKLD